VKQALTSPFGATDKTRQPDFEIKMAGDVDRLAGDAAYETCDHTIGVCCIGSCRAVNDFDLPTGAFEIVGNKAGAPVCQQMGDAEGEGLFLKALKKTMALAPFSAS
jgi:hypothetical protein